MTQTLINTNSVCRACKGVVKNIDGKRYTMDDLAEIHRASCAGRGLVPKDQTIAAAAKEVAENVR